MANASLQGNVAQELARRRVTEELLPRQSRLNQQYGPPDIPLPDNVVPYPTFEQPSDNVRGFFDPGYGDAPDAPASVSAPTGPAVSDGTQGFAAALGEAVSALGPAIGVPGMGIAAVGMALANMDAPDNSSAVDAGAAGSADASAGVGDSSATAVDGVSAADAAAMGDAAAAAGATSAATSAAADATAASIGDATAAATGDGGGGGGGGSKIVCTAMCQAYGFGAYRQNVWLEYSAKHLKKEHARGYHRIFRPLVKYAFHSGTNIPKRIVRHWLETIMRMRTVDLWHEMRGKNPHPVQRVIRRVCESICYGVGKL
jgi:hypothetical protein